MMQKKGERRKEGRKGDRTTNSICAKKKKKKKERKETYLKLGLIKQNRTGNRCILLMLRLKKETRRRKMSQQVYEVSCRKSLIQK